MELTSLPYKFGADTYEIIIVNEQSAETLYLTSVSLAELLFGIAAAQGYQIASRDMAPFEAANMDVINPWDGGAYTPGLWQPV